MLEYHKVVAMQMCKSPTQQCIGRLYMHAILFEAEKLLIHITLGNCSRSGNLEVGINT
jgi:hypothetical protein